MILGGVAVWLVLAIVVQLRYGTLATVVLVVWGGSMLVCVGYVVVQRLGISAWWRQRAETPPLAEPMPTA